MRTASALHNHAPVILRFPGPPLPTAVLFLAALILFLPVQAYAAPADGAPVQTAELLLAADQRQEQLVVQITVNGRSKGDFFVVRDQAGGLLLKVSDYAELGIAAPEAPAVFYRGESYRPIAAVAGAVLSFNESTLTLAVTLPTEQLQSGPQRTVIDLFSARQQNVYYPRERGAFFNYGLSYADSTPAGEALFTANGRAGARAGDLLFTTDGLYTHTRSRDDSVRLMSTATCEWRDRLQRLTLGDQFASSGELGSTINAGGIGFAKIYRMDPYVISYPAFSLAGAIPSATEVEIYQNGVLYDKRRLEPGDFELRNLQLLGGARTIEIVFRDPYGGEKRMVYPAYFSQTMLKQGLHEYGYTAGYLREQYGVRSNEYGDSAYSIFHRYGMRDSLNVGIRGEGGGGLANGGMGLSFVLPRLGQTDLSGAYSSRESRTGSAASLTHTFQADMFMARGYLQLFSRDYLTLSTLATGRLVRRSAGALASYGTGRMGFFGLGLSRDERYDGGARDVASASYTKHLGKDWMTTFTVRTVRDGTSEVEIFAALSRFLGGARDAPRVTAEYQRTRSETRESLELRKDLPLGEGTGYRVAVEGHQPDGQDTVLFNPSVQHNAAYGAYGADVNVQQRGGRTSTAYTVSAAGSLVYVGGFFGAGRPVTDSYVLAMADGVEGAGISMNGQDMGRTNRYGRLVIPNAASYGRNQIALESAEVPIDYQISATGATLSPAAGGGACLSFDVRRERAITGTAAVTVNNRKVPAEYAEIAVQVDGREIVFPTGKDGEFYMENALPDRPGAGIDLQSCESIAERKRSGGKIIQPGEYRARVRMESGSCEVTVTFPSTEDPITDIGEIHCVMRNEAEPAAPPAAAPPQPAAPAPQPAPPVSAPPAQRQVSEPAMPRPVSVGLQFDRAGNLSRQQDRRELAALARQLEKDPSLKLEIEVHGDRQGTERDRERTATRLGEQLRRALLRAGVRYERISAVNRGASEMVCTEAAADCGRGNRRAVLRLVGTNPAP